MNREIDPKKIAFIIIFTILLIVVVGIIFYVNMNKNMIVDIKATVKYVGLNDVIVIADDGQEYLISNLDCEYHEGDRLALKLANINSETEPIVADVSEVSVLSRSISFTIDDHNLDSNGQDDNISDENIINNIINSSESESEEDVVRYFEDIKYNLDKDSSGTISKSIKDSFTMMIDFIFYGSTIKGRTFAELTATTKLKILKITMEMNEKIEEKFPNYKKELSDKYQNVKSRVVAEYLDIVSDVCSNNEVTCESAKEGLMELKEKFSITWSFVKDMAGVGVDKLKKWYEVWKVQ